MGEGDVENPWRLTPSERELAMTKSRANRLGFAILLTQTERQASGFSPRFERSGRDGLLSFV